MDRELQYDPKAALVAQAGLVVPSLPVNLPRQATRAEIAQFVAIRAAACVGADYSNLALVDPADPAKLRLFHRPFLAPELEANYLDIPLAAPFPIAAAVRDQRTIVLNGADDYLEQFPDIWPDTQAAGVDVTVSLPLCRADGSPIGALGFAWSTSPPLGLKLDNALQAVGHLVAEIVERAEMYEAEHQLIADLHLRLLSALPRVDGVETAARYRPAGQSDAIGGDWFEGLVLDGGRLAVVVGDVTGHGLTAAADMALIRGVITALLHDGVEVGDVFARVSRVLSRRPEDLLATAALAVIDLWAGAITYATAGHPPPLVIQPDGTVTKLDQANAPILGIEASSFGIEASSQTSAQAAFRTGATLVMYTDGLVERRDRAFSRGIDEAVALLTQHRQGATPEQYIEILMDTLVGDRTDHDDVALVVVKNVSPTSSA